MKNKKLLIHDMLTGMSSAYSYNTGNQMDLSLKEHIVKILNENIPENVDMKHRRIIEKEYKRHIRQSTKVEIFS